MATKARRADANVEVESQVAPTIYRLLRARTPGGTICPSEVARALTPAWRPLMPVVRAVARRLALQGRLEIRQRGAALAAGSDFTGPIRLALPPGRISDS